jgi:hypothetical protein
LLDFYTVSDKHRRDALLALREDVWRKGWWDGYADDVDQRFIDYVWLEARAREIRTFDNTLLLGLLQTRDYARAVIEAGEFDRSQDLVDRGVELRMTRQGILTGDNPPRLTSIVDGAVLRRLIGGISVIRGQLKHLVECAERPNIEIRVLPFSAGAHASPAAGGEDLGEAGVGGVEGYANAPVAGEGSGAAPLGGREGFRYVEDVGHTE